jgi:hypothetical protein
MAHDNAVRAVAEPATAIRATDDDPEPSPAPRPVATGLVRWGASRWSWYDDTAAARVRGAARQRGPAVPEPVGSSSI